MPSTFDRAIPWGWPAAALLALLTLSSPAGAAPCPARPQWPTAAWPSRAAEVKTAKAAEIKALEDYAFTLVGKDEERKGIRTDGVVIIKGGTLVYERYARGYDESKRHIAWSVTKSLTSALTGIAVAKGALALEDSICKYVTPPRADNCNITVRHLLEFGSGLDWTEIYENKSNQASSVLAMLYGEGHKDTVAFVSGHKRRDEPGTTFEYSTGESLLLANLVAAALKPTLGEEYPWKTLFEPLGIQSAVIERDPKGQFLGGSHFYATPRDFAKFGYLYLNDGCWESQRILPEDWVRSSTTVSPPLRKKMIEEEDAPEGWQWWLNQPVPEQKLVKRPFADVPEDAFMALGHWGQSVTVIPSLDLVIVRTADDREHGAFQLNRFLALAIAVGS